jgi:methylated-DNA-[protein]-cysteine S-methyltransferase
MNTIATLVPQLDDTIVALTSVASPLGRVHVASVPGGVCAVAFDDRRDALERRLRRIFGLFLRVEPGDPLGVAKDLQAYFDGDCGALQKVTLATAATPMQRHVWALVTQVPAGSVTTYAALAMRLGMPRAQRAVGVCLASNPVPLFIPCHRVVAASGGLGSHPGGVTRKRWLLRHERALDAVDVTATRTLRAHACNAEVLDPTDVVDLVMPRVVGY